MKVKKLNLDGLTIKNERLYGHLGHLEEMLSMEERSAKIQELMEKNDYEAVGIGIIQGYMQSYIEICDPNRKGFDLTYATVDTLFINLAAMFEAQRRLGYDPQSNEHIIVCTLAALLSYLAINEHGYWFRVTSYLEQYRAGKAPKRPLWGSIMSVAVGKKDNYMDFLPSAREDINNHPIFELEDGLIISPHATIEAYKKLTGVDLVKRGLGLTTAATIFIP